MRRSATCLLICTLVCASSGCGLRKKQANMAATVGPVAVSTAPVFAQRESGYAAEPYPAFSSPAAVEDPYLTSTDGITRSGAIDSRYHTVAKKETLYSLARTYYGDHHRWKDIFEANRMQIDDPNRIRIGQRLLIP